MKIIYRIIVLVLGTVFFYSCEKEIADYYVEPKAAFSLSAEELSVNEYLIVYNESQGQQFVLFSGTENSNYDSINTTGAFAIQPDSDNKFTVSYTKGGTYTITLVASGIKPNEKETVVDVMQKEIFVNDTGKSILNIRFPSMYFLQMFDRNFNFSFESISPEVIMNGKYLSLEMHSTRNPLVTSTQNYMPFEGPENLRAKSVITLNTSNFDVTIDGQQFTNLITEVDYSNGVDMFVPKSVKVHPITGEPNEYELCILEIPQFKSFKLGTFTGNVVGEKTNHKIFYVDFEVPTETDVANMTAEFETFGEGVTVTSKGQPLESGNILQLEQDAVNVNLYSDTLDLYFAQPGYEEIFNISSKTIVTVTKQ